MSSKRRRTKASGAVNAQINEMRAVAVAATRGGISTDTAARSLADMTLRMMDMAGRARIMNRRVKTSPTPPKGMDAEAFNELLDGGVVHNERAARALSYDLSAREYTYKIITKTYQDVLTYLHYFQPCYAPEADHAVMTREMSLLDDMRRLFRAGDILHEVTGRALTEGKVFCWHDYRADKRHNKARTNRLVILPSDYCLIVEDNNPISKYTIAFDMGYFYLHPYALTEMEGLFDPWLDVFFSVTKRGANGGMTVDAEAFNSAYGPDAWASSPRSGRPAPGTQGETVPLWIHRAGMQQYWVELPKDRVWTFEIDDVTPWAAPIFTGLFKAIMKLSPAEDIFLELAQNPLVSMMTGEIPYLKDARGTGGKANEFSMSVTNERDTGQRSFHDMFYEMWRYELEQLGTKGVGGFFAPFEDMKLHQLAEAPNTDKLMSAAQRYALGKSGILGIIPATDSVLAGQIGVSKKMAAHFAQRVYRTFEKMFDQMTKSLRLTYAYEWHMFGNIFDDADEEQRIEKALTLGMLPDLFRYNALKGRSVLGDIAASEFILRSGLLAMRVPHQSSYHSEQPSGGAPGRPSLSRDGIENEETEGTIDKGEA